jgi:hypothetical protein
MRCKQLIHAFAWEFSVEGGVKFDSADVCVQPVVLHEYREAV